MRNLTIVCPSAGYPNLVRSLYTYREYAPEAKIIVVDQTPNGALSHSEITIYTDLYIKVYRALGFSKAMNMGIEMSDTEYVCCANDDVELVDKRWWDGIMYHFCIDRKVAGVNPASIKGYTNESDNLPCACNAKVDELTGNCLKCRAYKKVYSESDYDYLLEDRELKSGQIRTVSKGTKVDGIMTWFTVFKREALEMIKNNGCYFDERFYPGGGEDYDLMCRLYDYKDSGEPYRVIGVYNSWAYHHWFGTRIKNPPKIVPELKWNKLDRSADSKWRDNWDLWGRKDKSIPVPPCTKIPL
jgi:hypothetical protein